MVKDLPAPEWIIATLVYSVPRSMPISWVEEGRRRVERTRINIGLTRLNIRYLLKVNEIILKTCTMREMGLDGHRGIY